MIPLRTLYPYRIASFSELNRDPSVCCPCLQYMLLSQNISCRSPGVFPTGIGGVEQLSDDRPEQERVGLP